MDGRNNDFDFDFTPIGQAMWIIDELFTLTMGTV